MHSNCVSAWIRSIGDWLFCVWLILPMKRPDCILRLFSWLGLQPVSSLQHAEKTSEPCSISFRILSLHLPIEYPCVKKCVSALGPMSALVAGGSVSTSLCMQSLRMQDARKFVVSSWRMCMKPEIWEWSTV